MKTISAANILRLLTAALLCAAALNAATATTTRARAETPAATVHSGDAQTKAAPLPFEPGEELVYQADFSRLLLRGIEIAEMRFQVARRAPDAPAAAAAQPPANSPQFSSAQSSSAAAQLVYTGDVLAKGWFRKLFGIDFHYRHEAFVDPASLLILRTTKLDEQGKRVRASEAVFDRATNLQTWTERNPNDAQAEPRVVRNVLDGAAHDFLSAIYFLRAQPLQVGQSFELSVGDSGETFRVPVRVVERKSFKTVVGRVQTLRVDVGLFGAGRLVGDRTGEMSIWITDDARRLPVRARLNSDVGTLDIKLKKATGIPAAKKG